MNLLSNAIKYNRGGGTLSVVIADAGVTWGVSVSDTGIGMSQAELAGIFQEFYRVKSAKTSGIAGTGLGLATVKRVLSEYNASVGVTSVPDEGTTFTVLFPR